MPLFAPDPRRDTTAGVPWSPTFTGPRVTTRTTYTGGAARPAPTSGVVGYTSGGQPITQEDLDNYGAYFGQIGKEDRRRWDKNFGLQRDENRSQIEDRRARARLAADQLAEDRRQYDATFGEGQRRYNQDFGESQRRYNQDFGEDVRRNDRDFGESQRRYGLDFGLRRDTLGLDVLKTGAGLRGPLDAFQGAAFARGVETGGLAPYLQNLRDGGTVAYGGGTGTTGNPTPLTIGTLAQEMSGGGDVDHALAAPGAPMQAHISAGGVREPMGAIGPIATGVEAGATGVTKPPVMTPSVDAYGRPMLSPTYQANLNAIDATARRGLSHLGLGALENLSPSELATFKSGLSYLGRDADSEIEFYKRSRPGQRSALAG